MAARILVVDDQRANVEMMAGVLKARGYAVSTAHDGEQALEQVREIRPDLVVSDILMPNVDGYELCRRLRGAPETALLPVILVTSIDAHDERIKGLEAGADDFLGKPVNWEELFARERAVRMAIALQAAFLPISDAWAKLGHDVGLGIGIAQGEATLGVIGFEQRWEYAAIGNVPNLAARLCGHARAGEIILDAQTETSLGHVVDTESMGPLALRGFAQPVVAFRLKSLRNSGPGS